MKIKRFEGIWEIYLDDGEEIVDGVLKTDKIFLGDIILSSSINN